MRSGTPAASAVLLCLAALAVSQERSAPSLAFSGSAEVLLGYALADPFDADSAVARVGAYSGGSSLRLDAVGGYRDSAKVDASVLAGLLYGRADDPAPAFQVKKLYLSVFAERADLFAGRMILNYGRGTVFSPVDLFSGVDTADIALGRTGTDALRVLVPAGDFSGLELIATLAETPEDATAGARFYGNVLDWDFGLSAFRIGVTESAVFGLDFKGDALAGVSGEAAASVDGGGVLLRLMGGLDYSIGQAWFFDAEYLANLSFGEPAAAGDFPGARNLYASVAWTPDQLSSLSVWTIADFDGGEYRGTLSASRSIARGATLTGYAQYASGGASAPSLLIGTKLAVAY